VDKTEEEALSDRLPLRIGLSGQRGNPSGNARNAKDAKYLSSQYKFFFKNSARDKNMNF